MHKLIYGGIDSEDYKVLVTNAGIYKSPEKRYRKYTVPGRNGDLLEDTGTFENVEVEYPFCVYEDCDTNIRAYVSALKQKKGYQRMEDTYHPEYYRMGAFLGEFEPKEVTPDGEMCNGVLKFDCMPQKFLKSGEEPICYLIPDFWDSGAEYGDAKKFITSKIPIAQGYPNLSFTVNNNGANDALVAVYEYNLNNNETRTYYSLLRGGNTLSENMQFDNQSTHWRFAFYVSPNDTFLNLAATISGYATIDGNVQQFEAMFLEDIVLKNPSGYRAKPLFEFVSFGTGELRIYNFKNGISSGVYEDWYQITITGSAQYEHVWLDCDMQYMYDSNGANISNMLRIDTAQSEDGRSLVFPEFGENEIILQLDSTDREATSNAPNLVYVYPRWWKI